MTFEPISPPQVGGRRLLGWFAVAVAVAVVMPATSSATTLAVPSCPAKVSYGINPHPNCTWRTFASDKYVSRLTAKGSVAKLVKVGKGPTYRLTINVDLRTTLRTVCPGASVPLSMLPCRDAAKTVGVVGKYVRGSKSLSSVFLARLDTKPCGNGSGSPCCRDTARCTLHYRADARFTYGRLVLVVRVLQKELTKNPAGVLGQTGAEVPVVVTIPRVKT